MSKSSPYPSRPLPASLVSESRSSGLVVETPQHRLLEAGPEALSDAEILAVMLAPKSSGPGAEEATAEARWLLENVGGLAGLATTNPREIIATGFIGSRRLSLLAGIELAKRMARAELPARLPLGDPEAVARYLLLRYCERDQEVMGCLFLDVRNRLLGEAELFRGTLARASVEPRAILKEALLRSAAGVLLFHTHPSGDPSPSAEDLAFTRRVADAGELVGVRLLDHLVLGSGHRWVSLRRRGGW